MNYCCNSCAEAGIEEVAHSSCEAFHHKDHATTCHHETNENGHDDLACSNINHHPDGCHLLRVKVDTPSIQLTAELLKNKINTVDLFHFYIDTFTSINDEIVRCSVPPPDLVTHRNGRDILTLHAVLLI